jgi:hypothetical protein
LRSFYNYAADNCPHVIPMKPDGSFDVNLVHLRTKEVAEALNSSVNRGEGTNGWRIPKFLDMLHLPNYMGRLAATGRMHCGFAERGLKDWAKKPARTAQKRGGGVFEGQCAARIRERSMIDHGLAQMESDEEDSFDEEDPVTDDAGVGGSRYHIRIERDAAPHHQRKKVTCTRLDSRYRTHRLQDDLPDTILNYFKKLGTFDQIFEIRTEVMIDGTRYRAHPNYCGGGPWYDYVNVDFQLAELPDYDVYVDDHTRYPAKLVAFYRLVHDTEFEVLAHCAEFQELASDIYSRRTLLTRSWLYEVTPGLNPQPLYRTVGSIRDDIHVKGHVFAVEEIPGFHERYPSEHTRRFIVLSDMRKVWPGIFMDPANT